MQKISYINPNIFQGEAGFASLGGAPTPVNLRCPHCRHLGAFAIYANNFGFNYQKKTLPTGNLSTLRATIRTCPNNNCKGIVLVIENMQDNTMEVVPPQILDFSTDNLPKTCEETLKEAIACHAAGAYRAATMMVRRLLEEICEANDAFGDNLHQRLDALKSKIVLPLDLFNAMGELKALGNDAAHVEAKAYNNIGREEAEDSIEIAKEILKALYQLKGILSRLQARRSA